ncbi:thiamine-phosphate kinase [Sulfuricurvum sp.]|uniref:thiamine-phosphate kinase n=1 Tax=Sulfuricurvum sp. TaxID=2025608 RepID=UPI0025F06A05|nr:thiamine-phosphate kinase [Sulfuricurvum sp.]
MNVENYFIHTMSSPASRIGDDGALVGNRVYSKDLFFENIHFKRQWLTEYQIGYKAMMVNISDAIAMNAVPKYALLGIAMPRSMTLHQMDELGRGIKSAAAQYGIEIIGGDTISNGKLDISITIISETTSPLLRKGVKVSDCIAYTGRIGESARQLRYLLAGGKVHSQSRFVVPQLRQRFVQTARRYLRSGMDLSDGLFSDVEKLCDANRITLNWSKRPCKRVGCSGEEYEMLIAFDRRHLKALKSISKLTRTPLTVVGTAKRGRFVNRCKRHHF